jgi:hypothetical protein
MPIHFGATFYPKCATSTDDLLLRAEVALRIADKNSTRVQLDGAEAPDLPSPETLRQPEEALAQEAPQPFAIEAPAEAAEAVAAGAAFEPAAAFEEAAAEATAAIVAASEQAPAGEPVALEAASAASEAAGEEGVAEPRAAEEPEEPAVYAEPIPFPLERMREGSSAPEPAEAATGAAEAAAAAAASAWETAYRDDVEEPQPLAAAPQRDELQPVAASLEAVDGLEELEAVAAEAEGEVPEPILLLPRATARPEPAATVDADASITDIMKHLDETLAMIKALRTGTGP